MTAAPAGQTEMMHAAALALAVLADLADAGAADRAGAQFALAGHLARLEGVTDADLDERAAQVPEPALALMRGALAGPLTPLAAAALRLAAERPDLETMSKRDRAAVSRRYLPEQVTA